MPIAKEPKKPRIPYRKNRIAREIVIEAVVEWLLADRLAAKSEAERAAAQTAIAAGVGDAVKELLALAHPSDPREVDHAQSAQDAAPHILDDLFAKITPPAAVAPAKK